MRDVGTAVMLFGYSVDCAVAVDAQTIVVCVQRVNLSHNSTQSLTMTARLNFSTVTKKKTEKSGSQTYSEDNERHENHHCDRSC